MPTSSSLSGGSRSRPLRRDPAGPAPGMTMPACSHSCRRALTSAPSMTTPCLRKTASVVGSSLNAARAWTNRWTFTMRAGVPTSPRSTTSDSSTGRRGSADTSAAVSWGTTKEWPKATPREVADERVTRMYGRTGDSALSLASVRWANTPGRGGGKVPLVRANADPSEPAQVAHAAASPRRRMETSWHPRHTDIVAKAISESNTRVAAPHCRAEAK
eukprot:3937373-Rhodomonas_salina.1